MKLYFTTLFASLLFLTAYAQERTINGRLTSTEDGTPLPGVNITIKGTDISTITDGDGNYSIKVPIGGTLVFSFIGMQTREVIVTATNLQPVNAKATTKKVRSQAKDVSLKPIPRKLYQDSISNDAAGVATLTDHTPSYIAHSSLDPKKIKSIKQQGNSYEIKIDNYPVRRTGFSLQFTTSFGIEHYNKLPEFQSLYTQGSTDGSHLQWRGADQFEISSWGPLARTLEFDGSNYPYDIHGKLVPSGTGNGIAAKQYNPVSFFRTAFSNVNELSLSLPVPRYGTFTFDAEQRTRTGIIPNSGYHKVSLKTSVKNFKLSEKITSSSSIAFNRSSGSLLQRGANFTSIIGGIFRTPITFDNANGLTPEEAGNSNESYQIPDGTKRSHAPGYADNPYGLINELPDSEELNRLIAAMNLSYRGDGPMTITVNGSIDQQWNLSTFGIPYGYAGFLNGRFTNRIENQTYANGIANAQYYKYTEFGDLKFNLSYQAEFTTRELTRKDGYNFTSKNYVLGINEADSITTLNKKLSRLSHEVTLNFQNEFQNWLNARLTSKTYFSNTINKKSYVNFLPAASLSVNLAELAYLGSIYELKFYGTVSKTLRESSLIYSNWSYGSTSQTVESYARFYESGELFFNPNLLPETERKTETGLSLKSGKLNFEAAWYSNLTENFILPNVANHTLQLVNAGTIRNQGGFISAGITLGYWPQFIWGMDLKWSKYNSVVQDVQPGNERIALAGFESVQTVFSKGNPVGAIFGTSYLRNSQAQHIIGNDGFPIKDSNLKMIGNPIPDWILSWSSFFSLQHWKLSFLVDFKKGGDIWNGTSGVLDYLGRSTNTANQRNTSNYIFEGVDVNGSPNLIPVNFYDPAKPIQENRWARYGWDGVAEEHVEDASWIRLNEVAINYNITRNRGRNSSIKGFSVSFIARNLFLITHYSGVDPSATLFGYSAGTGLDLFNMPSTRSVHAQFTIQL